MSDAKRVDYPMVGDFCENPGRCSGDTFAPPSHDFWIVTASTHPRRNSASLSAIRLTGKIGEKMSFGPRILKTLRRATPEEMRWAWSQTEGDAVIREPADWVPEDNGYDPFTGLRR